MAASLASMKDRELLRLYHDQGDASAAAHSKVWGTLTLTDVFGFLPEEVGGPALTPAQLAWALGEAGRYCEISRVGAPAACPGTDPAPFAGAGSVPFIRALSLPPECEEGDPEAAEQRHADQLRGHDGNDEHVVASGTRRLDDAQLPQPFRTRPAERERGNGRAPDAVHHELHHEAEEDFQHDASLRSPPARW